MFQHIVYSLANRQGLFAYVRTCKTQLAKYNNLVTSLFNLLILIIPWEHVLPCMNMAVNLSCFQQLCSSLFVHQAMNTLFQHAWTSLSSSKGKNKLCVLTYSVHVCSLNSFFFSLFYSHWVIPYLTQNMESLWMHVFWVVWTQFFEQSYS